MSYRTLASYAGDPASFFALDIEHRAEHQRLLRTVWPPVIERACARCPPRRSSRRAAFSLLARRSARWDGGDDGLVESRIQNPAATRLSRLDADRALVDGGRCLTAGTR